MTAETMIFALEALHSPIRGDFDFAYPRCGGCDVDGWEAEEPQWPCSTALVLWPDPDERDAVLADWQEWADARAAEARAKFVPGGRPQFIADVWSAQVMDSLRATSVYLRPGENQ